MYKVFLRFPEALRPAFPRLKEKLEDPDPGVQSAAVNVICELARKNPKNYLSLAPLFFKLMTSSTNNWVLIKIIKLFSALTPLEPRLGKKLIEPLTNLIHSTSAMSLLYECINTVIAVLISISTGIPNHSASIQLCVQKLRILIEDSDQNLKYLGLLAMSRILATHPKSVQSHKDLILQCLDDKDESIRLRALDLLYGMVSKKNLMEIVKKLMIHMDKAEGTHYRDELLSKIIEICSQSNYQYVVNFEWYVSILVELTRMEGTRHGRLIASQMLDVAIRVQAIRQFAVSQMAILLENSHLLANNSQRNGICEVLYAAAWICGEFSEHVTDPKVTLEAMLKPKITALPGHIQSVYVQNILKLYGNVLKQAELEENDDLIRELGQLMSEKLPMFVQSADLEVQERACCMLQLVKYVMKLHDKGAKVGTEVATLFAGELNPVARKAQRKVPVPEGLDLDRWINEPPSESSDEDVVGKKKEKKRLRKLSENAEEPNLLVKNEEVHPEKGAVVNGPVDLQENNGTIESNADGGKVDDFEFWLSASDATTPSPTKAAVSPTQDISAAATETEPSKAPAASNGVVLSSEEDEAKMKEEKSKKKKEKKQKKDKKEKKDKRKHRHKIGYEEAEGITTPSKEQLPLSQQDTPMTVQLPPMSSYKLLAENSTIKTTYEIRVSPQRKDQVVVSIVFSNLSDHHLKDLEFNVLETLNTKLIRSLGASHHDAVKVPFVLLPKAQNEGQFAFTVQAINMPQKMKGTLTYIEKTEEGSSHEKLDFKLSFPCCCYMVATPCKSADFATLLGSGDLSEVSSIKFTPSDEEMAHVLGKICFYLHFRIVEQVENSASLYSRSMQGHHMCLLVKLNDKTLNINGKSTDASLLSNVLEDVKITLTNIQ
ncbi:hypothetical protein ScPMuIL_002017 [Solemya velum]